MSADTVTAVPKRGSPRAGTDYRSGRRSRAFFVKGTNHLSFQRLEAFDSKHQIR